MEESITELIRTQLRRLRIAAGLSQEEFGRLVHFSSSAVSAVETGVRPLDRAFLARADEVLNSGDLLVTLLRMAERDREPSWFKPWLEAERGATQLRYFNPNLIPGMLQTENYARAVLRFNDTFSEAEVERHVAARMTRQDILTREEPPQYVAVLDESVLSRTAEGLSGIMVEQIGRLIELAALPHVHIHLVPRSSGLHIGSSGPFALARSADGGWVGHLEHQLGGAVVDDEHGVAALLTKWENVRAEALPRRQTIDLMKEVQASHEPQ
ncbi:Helix-turn-helix domain-containing protein [Micromonospora halophytica]|uniref:Helix-turn-helix domain-containing protein n=1 Tax=Micromonospora halophytica TaxID=47864 RepID=A0A1C5J9Z1_9ACTN|nr:helix-turn-helix transcriptional regulator [Micromonospora halophytica]SCG67353.1 Helix-turn-helix domain-containing protein [Micromonospora halophytica]